MSVRLVDSAGPGDPGVRVLARAVAVLRCFSAEEPEWTASRLARRCGLSTSTAHRLAGELARLGLLERWGAQYSLGLGLWELGQAAPVAARLRECALPFMSALYDLTGENVHLAVLSDADPWRAEALYVAKVTGPRAIPTRARQGGRHPLHTTGVGKALLASQPGAWRVRYVRRPLARETVHSVVDPGALLRELRGIAVVGVAKTRQEQSLGNVSLAVPVPVLPGAGVPAAALGVVVHLSRADERRLVPALRRAASGLAKALDQGG